MKAFEIKTLSATETKPMRLKVSIEQIKPVIYSAGQFDVNSVDCIELQAAKKLMVDLGYDNNGKFTLKVGRLPNGNYCAVFVDA